MNKKILAVTFLLFSFAKLAAASASLEQVADNLFGCTTFLTKLLWAASLVCGVFFLAGNIVQWQNHRSNPKMVPLSSAIITLILGLICIGLPFLDRMFGSDAYDVVTKDCPKSSYNQ